MIFSKLDFLLGLSDLKFSPNFSALAESNFTNDCRFRISNKANFMTNWTRFVVACLILNISGNRIQNPSTFWRFTGTTANMTYRQRDRISNHHLQRSGAWRFFQHIVTVWWKWCENFTELIHRITAASSHKNDPFSTLFMRLFRWQWSSF